jgi:hypothetical protein
MRRGMQFCWCGRGGFGQAGTDGADCWSGSGGDGCELPFAPILSEYVSGGGAGGLTCYTRCSNPIVGRNGSGQRGHRGGGEQAVGIPLNPNPYTIPKPEETAPCLSASLSPVLPVRDKSLSQNFFPDLPVCFVPLAATVIQI